MPQETNLNVAPYFDDFDPISNYYKVLFKPGYPIQARELNNVQSIFQDQIENVGNHFFNEGAKVIPGNTSYYQNFQAIQINSSYAGIPVSLYLDQLVGKKITGRISGVTANIVTYIDDSQSENGNYTLYINYLNSGNNFDQSTFQDGEVLNTDENIQFSNTFISSGEGFSQCLSTNSNQIGSAYAVSQGVYFLRGTFVDVYDQLLILDQYSNVSSYRIGFFVKEELVSSSSDNSLNDNAQGFTNYTAPGADRLKISATLSKKNLDDFDDQNFIQIAVVTNGRLRTINNQSDRNNSVRAELARRTFDESGHYYVKEFVTTAKDSLFGINERGIYNVNQITDDGNNPRESLGVYKISPGKAYVRGFEIDRTTPTFLDFEKPRTTRTVENQSINFGFGPTFTLNRISGSPRVGFNTDYTISFRDKRVGINSLAAPGREIGLARVYDFSLESGSYNLNNLNENQWDLAVYDIQPYLDMTLNQNATLTVPTFIEGKSSGATGFIRYPVEVGTAATVYNIQGDFHIGERIVFDGDDSNGRTAVAFTSYGISDFKSVFGITGTANTFTADIIPSTARIIGIASITENSGGVSTVTASGLTFPGITTVGDLVSFSIPGQLDIAFAEVSTINTNNIIIQTVTSVPGICTGQLNVEPLTVNDFSILKTNLQDQIDSGNSFGNNDTLYSVLPKLKNESVDLENAVLDIRRSFSVTIDSNGDTSVITAGNKEVFLNYDDERYSVTKSNGTIEPLNSGKLVLSSGNQNARFVGLSGADTDTTIIATLRKTGLTNKQKVKNEGTFTLIDKSNLQASGTNSSGISTTLNDGLLYGNYPFGTRIQDKIISLNVPDVVTLYGLFESTSDSDPVPPTMTTGSMDGPTNSTEDISIGEFVIGTNSGAAAIVIGKIDANSIEFAYGNNKKFTENEIISFSDSGVRAISADVTIGDKNIIDSFNLIGGGRNSIYDYSRIVRKVDASVPNGKIKAYYMSASYNSSDTGDITTVNSYSEFNYANEIPITSGVRNTDLIDARPRVSNFSVSEGSRSPLEFLGRSFTGNQHSSKDVIASDESITIDYSYYLPRIDSIYLNQEGVFSVIKGTPSDNPETPNSSQNGILIANAELPAYLFTTKDVKISSLQYKRYQMSDINRIENRVRSLEYYTSLNALETLALDQFVADSNGLDRFKNGIFVDGFTDITGQDYGVRIKNAIDQRKGVLRPSHYCTAINLQIGTDAISGISSQTNTGDPRYANIVGTNIKRNIKNDGDTSTVLSLDYTEQEWLNQQFATRTESVTPFLVTFYDGNITLDPTADVWIDTTQLEVRAVDMMGSLEGVAAALQVDLEGESGSRRGQSDIIWEAWEFSGQTSESDSNTTRGTRRRNTTTLRQGTIDDVNQLSAAGNFQQEATLRADFAGENFERLGIAAGTIRSSFRMQQQTTEIVNTETTQTTTTTFNNERREGIQFDVSERVDTESFGNRIVSRDIIHSMRQRNIEFFARAMRPFTRVYSFFDNVAITPYCTPKLIEIEMVSGTFQSGERIVGRDLSQSTISTANQRTTPILNAVLCNSNHRAGNRLQPTDIFTNNPYDRNNIVPSQYSAASTILNIDTKDLSDENAPASFGHVTDGMRIVGQTSGAQANVINKRFITDRVGGLVGCFEVPNASNLSTPSFDNGRNRFRLTSSSTNSKVPGSLTTAAEETFYSQGDSDQNQEVTLSLRNAEVVVNDREETRREVVGTTRDESTDDQDVIDSTTVETGVYRDPLAQTFTVDDEEGIFITSIDIFFQSVDFENVVEVELRETELGLPVPKRIAGSLVVLDPGDPALPLIRTSDDGSEATRVTFDYPVYLNSGREYAVVLLSNVPNYRVWISRLGEIDISSIGFAEGSQTLVSTQPTLGSLFKSQTGSTWTPSQFEDLKFRLNRANFQSNGTVNFYNPDLPFSQEVMKNNPITIIRNEVRVGLGTTVADIDFTPGTTVTQKDTVVSGKLVSSGSSISQTPLTITNPGFGFTPAVGGQQYDNVSLTSVTGTGINASANITIENGVAIAATINSGGKGYFVGDVLTPTQIGANPLGSGLRLTVSDTAGVNELTLVGVQGDFSTIEGRDLLYQKPGVGTTSINAALGGAVVPTGSIINVSDGQHIKVSHLNHGMHSNSNIVQLKNIISDLDPVSLINAYSNTSSGSDAITIASVGIFTSFENIAVGATNPGYVKIGDEIISYTGTTATTLTGVGRGVDNTVTTSHSASAAVSKYELGGVSLRRINKQHNLNEVTVSNPITLDSYHVKVGMATDGTNRTGSGSFSALKFNETREVGGEQCKATYNVPFSIVKPVINVITPTQTNIDASLRTISETSISGNESPFVDQGFENITINRQNYFNSLRMVSAKVNENTFLNSLPGNKSLTMKLDLSTTNPKLSPMIDLDQSSIQLISNRVNSVVTNYATDLRVSSYENDPTNFTYITKNIALSNSSTALRVLLNAYVNTESDIRVFYALNQQVSLDQTVFVPFPGFENIDSTRGGAVINPANNNGKSSIKVNKIDAYTPNPSSANFREYTFTIDNQPSFNSFRIKIIGTSTNQAFVPQIRSLRAIALA